MVEAVSDAGKKQTDFGANGQIRKYLLDETGIMMYNTFYRTVILIQNGGRVLTLGKIS